MNLNEILEWVDLKDLKPYKDNPKKHTTEQINSLAKSITDFGFSVPLVISETGEIITGHARFLAAKSLGMDKVPCIRRGDLSPDQVRAFRIMDNKTLQSPWDLEKLAEEYYSLQEEGIYLEEVKKMVEGREETEPHEPELTEEIIQNLEIFTCEECGYEFPK